MPELKMPAMEEITRSRFQDALLEINLGQADGKCRLDAGTGDTSLRATISAQGYRAEALKDAVDLVERELRLQRAVIETDQRGNPRVRESVVVPWGNPRVHERTIVPQFNYPVEPMNREQEAEFHQDINRINQGISQQECSFETLLDDAARTYLRYRLYPQDQEDL